MFIKQEPGLDVQTKTCQLKGSEATEDVQVNRIEKENEACVSKEGQPSTSSEGVLIYVCYHCRRNFGLFKHLRSHVKNCFSANNVWLGRTCVFIKEEPVLEESMETHHLGGLHTTEKEKMPFPGVIDTEEGYTAPKKKIKYIIIGILVMRLRTPVLIAATRQLGEII